MSSRPNTNKPDKKDATARSRSEIENALSGRTARAARKSKPAASSTFDLNAPPRRQQVIGGDLTGVIRKPKFGIFSRYSDVSITNWIAAAIVLLILAAFFWPQGGPSTQEIANNTLVNAPQLGETDLNAEDLKALAEQEKPVNGSSFSRDDDIERASNYREQDAKDLEIRGLLEQAQAASAKGQYTSPPENNAIAFYKQVLSIAPRNVTAREGIDYINSRFLQAGYSALESDNQKAIEVTLAKLNSIDPESDESLELNQAFEGWKLQQSIDQTLAKARAAFNNKFYILPAKENALYYYQQVLTLDESHAAATRGVQRIADVYVENANQALSLGQYQAASAHLATVSIIDPDHESIAILEAIIAKGKPLAEQARTAQQTAPATAQRAPTQTTASPTQSGRQSNTARTPSRQTSEQQAFDRQYLKEGLEAYYKGDYQTAAALLQPLADKGIARAQFRLAYMHYLGRGFKRNRQLADSIIRTSLPAIQGFANDGRAWAQSDLGSLYEDGLVLTRNYTDAVYWYRSAAEQGYPGAQTNLGIMYARGRGVNASRRTAIQWFQRAAKQGDRVAQRNLEAMGVK